MSNRSSYTQLSFIDALGGRQNLRRKVPSCAKRFTWSDEEWNGNDAEKNDQENYAATGPDKASFGGEAEVECENGDFDEVGDYRVGDDHEIGGLLKRALCIRIVEERRENGEEEES
jgi:hypothetical protein